MSQTQEEKQQAFREKLKTKGADGFADGPQPWEQWDESGIQGDNRIWEGTARRIYTKKSTPRGIGERLLSGLAMVAIASLVAGIAGVYFSVPTTLQQASSKIQPAPIVASRHNTRPSSPAETTALAQLDTLPSPAAGISTAPQKPLTVLQPTFIETLTDSQTDTLAQTDSVDQVSVETVITEAAVTTTITTRQPSQHKPNVVAMIATTAPPFTHEAIAETNQADTPVTAAVREEQTAVIEPLVIEQAEESATAALVVAEQAAITIPEHTDASAADPMILAQADFTAAEPAVIEQAEAPASAPDVIEQTTTITPEPPATEPLVVAQAEPAVTEPLVVAQAEPAVTEPLVVAQAEPAVTEPPVVAQAEPAVTEPLAIEQLEAPATETAIALNTTESSVETAPDITRELETATQTLALPVTATGQWVINLSSYTRLSTAERMLAVFKQKGVDAEIFTTTVNDKPMHRIRVAGFANSRSAKAEISTLEQQLGLNDAWISRR
jgi:hypothetical protein